MSSRLKIAEERIEKAIARIDAVLARPRQGQNLEPRIAALECENAVLREQNDEIAVRLGAAIGRLQQILKGPYPAMPELSVTINGRNYTISCEAGQAAAQAKEGTADEVATDEASRLAEKVERIAEHAETIAERLEAF